jgi:hypothetical protein
VAYLIIAVVVVVSVAVVVARLAKGWRARNTPDGDQFNTRVLVPVAGVIAFAGLAYLYAAVGREWIEHWVPQGSAEPTAKRTAPQESIASELVANRAAIVSKIRGLQASGKLYEARAEIGKYSVTGDGEIAQLAASIDAQARDDDRRARIVQLEAIVNAAREADTLGKRNGYKELLALDPENKEYQQKYNNYQKRLAVEEENKIRAAKIQKRKEGVHIGMSKEDVLASSWGRPDHVNVHMNARGRTEQWVYGGSNYLYFDEDTLTAIQTSR